MARADAGLPPGWATGAAGQEPIRGRPERPPAARAPDVQDLDVTVLAFAQWLHEMRSRSSSSLQQMMAEMGIIRNGIASNNADLAEFKRSTATVQQEMQKQISDLHAKMADACADAAGLKASRVELEREVLATTQSFSDQLAIKAGEAQSMQKAYAAAYDQLQQELSQLQGEVRDLRMRDDAQRQARLACEGKVCEVEASAQLANKELLRLRTDHDQSVKELSGNMGRWNDTVRDLAKEFHDFRKAVGAGQGRLDRALADVQAAMGPLSWEARQASSPGRRRPSPERAGPWSSELVEPVASGGPQVLLVAPGARSPGAPGHRSPPAATPPGSGARRIAPAAFLMQPAPGQAFPAR